jgi:hypothetical protein
MLSSCPKKDSIRLAKQRTQNRQSKAPQVFNLKVNTIQIRPPAVETPLNRGEAGTGILCRLLRVDHAPALSSNRSIHGFAGGWGFELHAIFAALISLWCVLILHNFLRRLSRLRGRGCADDHCCARDRGSGHAGRDCQRLPSGNSW